MDKASTTGMMGAGTTDSGKKTKLMGLESTIGLMVDSMKASGKITTCMAKELTSGLTEEHTKETTLTTRNMGTELTLGQTGGSTSENGKVASSTVEASTSQLTRSRGMVNGKTVREQHGPIEM